MVIGKPILNALLLTLTSFGERPSGVVEYFMMTSKQITANQVHVRLRLRTSLCSSAK
jgi:hypothetical protein